jgi:hypothetical protein
MSIADVLTKLAERFVKEVQQRKFEAKEEYDRQEAQLREARSKYNAAADLASRAAERTAHFVPMLGSNFQCPRCWVCDENRSPLMPIPVDLFRCNVCGLEISAPERP